MIGRIRGKLIEKQPPNICLEVAGIGYEIEATMNVIYALPEINEETVIYTHLVVRDDAHLLYGFASPDEKAMFRELIKISGVGAKLALTLLSGMSPDDLVHCVNENNLNKLTRLPGVGKKTAERLLLELGNRLGKNWFARTGDSPALSQAPVARSSPVDEATDALISLGYRNQEARRMIGTLDTTSLSCEEIIRSALQNTLASSS